MNPGALFQLLLQLFFHFILPAAAILLVGTILRLVFAGRINMSKDLKDFLAFKPSTWLDVADSGLPVLRPLVWLYERVSGAGKMRKTKGVKRAPPVVCSSCGRTALFLRREEGFTLCLSCGKKDDI
jgi:hypothetical protein